MHLVASIYYNKQDFPLKDNSNADMDKKQRSKKLKIYELLYFKNFNIFYLLS